MTTHGVSLKKYAKDVDAQLHEIKSELEHIEARAKKLVAHVELDTISALKRTKQHIDRKRKEFQKVGAAKAAQMKSEIEADIAGVKLSLEQLATKLKNQASQKVRQVTGR